MKIHKRYNTPSFKHLEEILIKEGGVLGTADTKERAIAIRNSYYNLRTWIMNINYDEGRHFLREMLCDMIPDITLAQFHYVVELKLSPLARAARHATGETPEASFARRYHYAKQWGLEHLLVETQP